MKTADMTTTTPASETPAPETPAAPPPQPPAASVGAAIFKTWAATDLDGYFRGRSAALGFVEKARAALPPADAEGLIEEALTRAVQDLAREGKVGLADDAIDCVGSLPAVKTKKDALQIVETPRGKAFLDALRGELATYSAKGSPQEDRGASEQTTLTNQNK